MLTDEQIKTLAGTGSLSVTLNGIDVEFRLTRDPDSDLAFPWVEYDGYGVISGWEARDKASHERILANDGRWKMFYDVTASMEKARKEGWGLLEEEARDLTPKQIIAKAVEKDFQYCKRWSDGDIWWTTLKLAVYVDGEELELATQYMGGIESDTKLTDCIDMIGGMVAEAESALRVEAEAKADTFTALNAALRTVD